MGSTLEHAVQPFTDGPMSAMSFSQALSLAANEGAWIRRQSWTEHQWLGIVRPETFGMVASGHDFTEWTVESMPANTGFTRNQRPDIGNSGMLFYTGSRSDAPRNGDGVNRTNTIVFGWTPSADDMLAQDWTVYTP